MNEFQRVLIATSLALAGAQSARAQAVTAPQPLGDVLVTATRVPTSLREVTESVSVISRAEIDRIGAATGVDLFRQLPGLQIDQLGGPGGLSSVYIRGSDPNHVLVLIDGVRVNDPTNSRGGGFDLSSLDPGTIDHVEVLRGAASAVYGADAMGGVINIVTRNGLGAAGTGGSASLGAGGQGWRRAGGQVAAGGPGLRFSVGASALKDGSDAEGGRLELRQLSGATSWSLGPRASIGLALRHSDRDSSSFPDDSGGIRLAEIRTLEQKQASETTISGSGRWAGDLLALTVAASSYRHLEDIDSPGVAPGVRNAFGVPSSVSHTDFRRHNASVTAVFDFDGSTELAVGAEYQREQGGNRTVYSFFGTPLPADFDLSRNTRSEFAELKWQSLEDLIVRVGARNDAVDGAGSHLSPTAGFRYNLNRLDASLKLNYAEGFRPPSFFALGLPVPLGGNPSLRPEHSQGGAIGYDQRFWGEQASAGVTYFQTNYTDLVTFDNETNRLVNANRVEIRGTEFEARWQATPALTLQAHYTHLVSHVIDSNEPLRQRPGRRGGMQLAWAVSDDSTLNWRTEYCALVFDSSIPTGNLTLPTWLRSDVSYVWRWRPTVSLSAAIDNAFDKHNESYVGAVAPGRRLRLAVSTDL